MSTVTLRIGTHHKGGLLRSVTTNKPRAKDTAKSNATLRSPDIDWRTSTVVLKTGPLRPNLCRVKRVVKKSDRKSTVDRVDKCLHKAILNDSHVVLEEEGECSDVIHYVTS
ncbi:hypothetical protein PTSG_02791 [Salpingoeca rosetta]|uniref:Uncharacterized protein n=1 Tax=Salpingoeca rosetta (strain ATCC 50818 / BSB-021) TaxID=946362 RepID=F2U3C1_SALR5|nr:uncharacterized protein PTSG_02791 [Salpingoeca rosetta]EGD82115.1 hypothetical protein PTSG_02791 [Salpingoeca rosetta]|eukprot:XP_004996298.1 hypothetical protein PTSG_02791 [Salpingoeca rosetta]